MFDPIENKKGFESLQTQYPEPELNRHGPFGPQDFKSCVSTCFTTRAPKSLFNREDKCSIIHCVYQWQKRQWKTKEKSEIEYPWIGKLANGLCLVALFLSPVHRFEDLVTTRYRWLHKFFATALFLDEGHVLIFTLVPFEGAVNGLWFFYFDNEHYR